ncbi:hypothetical protein V1477_008339 [Vespula maculifrons]|uniref:Uncharacterized protein n=1 Tax=Vespula maculifrons TaxID=7453 RepID=A0ABD2CCS9_VESMC
MQRGGIIYYSFQEILAKNQDLVEYWFRENYYYIPGFLSGSHDMTRGGTRWHGVSRQSQVSRLSFSKNRCYWFCGNFIGKLGFVSGSHDMRRGGTRFRASFGCRNNSDWFRGNVIGKLGFLSGSHDMTRGGTRHY